MGHSPLGPRYYVKPLGHWRLRPGLSFPTHFFAVVDSQTDEVVDEVSSASLEEARAKATRRASELNAPDMALDMLFQLDTHITTTANNEANPGDLLEDVSRILAHFMNQLQGLTREPLDQERLYLPAPVIP